MKKIVASIVLLAMLLTILIGCRQSQKAEQPTKLEPPKGLDTVYDMHWASELGYYEDDILIDEDLAKAVAQQIFNNVSGDRNTKGYKLQRVTYYEAENAWMCFFAKSPKKSELSWLGGGCTIALNKTDGHVMRIFWW